MSDRIERLEAEADRLCNEARAEIRRRSARKNARARPKADGINSPSGTAGCGPAASSPPSMAHASGGR